MENADSKVGIYTVASWFFIPNTIRAHIAQSDQIIFLRTWQTRKSYPGSLFCVFRTIFFKKNLFFRPILSGVSCTGSESSLHECGHDDSFEAGRSTFCPGEGIHEACVYSLVTRTYFVQ